MSLNNTPASERIHIGIFGKRNAGKSSVINAITGQSIAIVSDVKGTTTDPVIKTMELLPLGPVVIIDTPGLDDIGTLGQLRIQKTYQMLNKTDIAIVVIDASIGITKEDKKILDRIKEKAIPYIVVWNKTDLLSRLSEKEQRIPTQNQIQISTKTGENILALKELIAKQAPNSKIARPLISDLLNPGDFVVLVVPIDSSAPKGRLILPQQQTIREILDSDSTAIVVKDTELEETIQKLGHLIKLVITDSQVFQQVVAILPPEIPLTSFSILFARYKGNLKTLANGAKALDTLDNEDTILISEGCTHHRQCNDIGTVKLPRLIQKHTGKKINFAFTSGTEFPEDLSPYRMIIHCGGCMLNEREMKYRLKCAEDQHVPITNYGTAIAHMNNILTRSLEPFESESQQDKTRP